MSENYPFSVTFHGKDIVEVRQGMVDFLADNIQPGVNTKTPQGKSPGKKPRKSAKKKETKDSPGSPGNSSESPSLSADTDTAPEAPSESDSPGEKSSPEITPDEHPNVSLSYNNALERLMEIYNGSPEGAYEVTLLLENYRVASFREIPEDRGIELLGKAEDITAALDITSAQKQEST